MPSPVEPIQLPTWLFVLVIILPAISSGLSGWFASRAKDLRDNKKEFVSQQRKAVSAVSASLNSLFELFPGEQDSEMIFVKAREFHRTVDSVVDRLPRELDLLPSISSYILSITRVWRTHTVTTRASVDTREQYSHLLNALIDDTYKRVIKWRSKSPTTPSDSKLLDSVDALKDFVEKEKLQAYRSSQRDRSAV